LPGAARHYSPPGKAASAVLTLLGHKTCSNFDRCNITSEQHLRRAADSVGESTEARRIQAVNGVHAIKLLPRWRDGQRVPDVRGLP